MTIPSPQELVERALDASTSDRCLVIVRVGSSANLRWANNTLTTNGVMRRSSVTAVSFADKDGGTATGAVTGTAATVEQVERIVAAADTAARTGRPCR
jgi:hypothetical protein